MTSSALTRPGERDRLVVKFGEIDWVLVLMLCLLALSGGLMLYSIAGGSWKPWALPQITRFGLCVLLMLGLALVNLRVWFAVAYPVYAIGLLLLVGVAFAGHAALGATRWLSFGGEKFQPSEVMKIGLVLALARFYHGMPAETARLSWRLLIPAGLIAVPVLLVAKQPDLGTAILLAATGGAVMMLAGLSLRLIVLGLAGIAVAVPPFVMFVLKGYQRGRILTFLHPENDPSGSGYHILQAKIALGSGGILGKGFGLGSQSQLNFLPEKQTDFIFATLAEEFGLVGCISMLALYAATIVIALRIASLSHSHFGRLSAAGVTATFAFYVLINGAMVMGLAPVVGVPMPLLSYGGTVMLTVMVGFGLVQSVRVHRYSEVTRGEGTLLSRPEVVIRRLGAEDAEAYRAIRLAGLLEAPEAFSSTHEAEVDRPIEHFRQRVAGTAIFGAFLQGRIVGMAGFYRESSPKERHKGMLWGMYVAPDARRFRLGADLVQAVLDHAAGEVEQVRLAVSHGNAAAIGLYERLGFVAYGHEPRALKGPNGYSDDLLMVRFLRDLGEAAKPTG